MAAVGLVASFLLGFVFLVSGASKIAAGPAWPEQARGLGAPSFVVPVLAAVTALVVLVLFTALIARRLAQGQHPPCACFGTLSTKPLGRGHVIRNVGFMALAVAALLA